MPGSPCPRDLVTFPLNPPPFRLPRQAVYLWGYARSGFAPLLERAQAGISTMMEGYPSRRAP